MPPPRRLPSPPLTLPYIWIPDSLLTDALHRVLRALPSAAVAAAASPSPQARLLPSVPSCRRHGSHVPGPLEANRRLARRRMGVAVDPSYGGGEVGGMPPVEWSWGGNGSSTSGGGFGSAAWWPRVPTFGELVWEAPKGTARDGRAVMEERRTGGGLRDEPHASQPQIDRSEPSVLETQPSASLTARERCADELRALTASVRKLECIRRAYSIDDLDHDAFAHLVVQHLHRNRLAGAVGLQMLRPAFLDGVDLAAAVARNLGPKERAAFFRAVMGCVNVGHPKVAGTAADDDGTALVERIEALWERLGAPVAGSLDCPAGVPLWAYNLLVSNPKASIEGSEYWKGLAEAILRRVEAREVTSREVKIARPLMIRLRQAAWQAAGIVESVTPPKALLSALQKLVDAETACTEASVAQLLVDLRLPVDAAFCGQFRRHLRSLGATVDTQQAILDRWFGVLKLAGAASSTRCSIDWDAVIRTAAELMNPLNVAVSRVGMDDVALCRILIRRWASSCDVCCNHAAGLEAAFLDSTAAMASDEPGPAYLAYHRLLSAVRRRGIVETHMMSDILTLVLRAHGTSVFADLLDTAKRDAIVVRPEQIADALTRAGASRSGHTTESSSRYWTEYLTAMIERGVHSERVFTILQYRSPRVASNTLRPIGVGTTAPPNSDAFPEFAQLIHDLAWPLATARAFPRRVRLRNVVYCCQILRRHGLLVRPSLARALLRVAVHEQLDAQRPVSAPVQRYVAGVVAAAAGADAARTLLAALAGRSDRLAATRDGLERMKGGTFRALAESGALDPLPTEYLRYILRKRALAGRADTSRRFVGGRREGVHPRLWRKARSGVRRVRFPWGSQ